MNKYQFGSTSKARRDTCCKVLRVILDEAIANAPFDFGIVCGYRGQEMQDREYIEGDSMAKFGQSGHNVMKGTKPYSVAVDVAPYSPELQNYIWNDRGLFEQLFEHIRLIAVTHGVVVIWGGNFKSIKGDLGHIEIVI